MEGVDATPDVADFGAMGIGHWGICCGGLAHLQWENAGNGSGSSGNQLERRLRRAGLVVTPQVLTLLRGKQACAARVA